MFHVCVCVGPFLFVSELFMSPALILDMPGLLSKHKESQLIILMHQLVNILFILDLNAPCHVRLHAAFLR